MRTLGAAVCLLVATLVAPLAVGASWLAWRVDSTGAYVDSVAPLADDPRLRAELSSRLRVAAIGAVEQHLPAGVPPTLDATVGDAVTAVVEGPDFPALWREVNADAHRELRRIVHEDRPVGGRLTLDLSPLLERVLDQLGGAGLVLHALPPAELQVPVVERRRLAEAGGPYRALVGAGVWLPLLWAGLVVLGTLVATGVRGRLRTLGAGLLGLALGAAALLLVRGPVVELVTDDVVPERRGLVRLFAEAVLDGLHATATAVLLIAGLLGLGLVLASLWPGPRNAETARGAAG